MSAPALGRAVTTGILDAHVHVWDPASLRYPWLDELPALARPFLAADYAHAIAGIPIDSVIRVEANCLPDETLREVDFFEHRAEPGPPVAGIVAFASLTMPSELDRLLDTLAARPKVKGIRHNIQGEAPGFCTQASFLDGVRKVGARGLTFDLCATHNQLSDVLQLVRACPDARFVLDHCGKPAIRDGALDPWRADIACLAECGNVWCKLSGLVTEASHTTWREADLVPFASHVVERFGTQRVMYGSDWPVLSLVARYSDWFAFTERFTERWSDAERRRFYHDNATSAYALGASR
jgi:predicted TIM-barrel fold metal-dependent hydrolase